MREKKACDEETERKGKARKLKKSESFKKITFMKSFLLAKGCDIW